MRRDAIDIHAVNGWAHSVARIPLVPVTPATPAQAREPLGLRRAP
jgi:hypothetical protein